MRNSGQYRSEGVEGYELNTMRYLLKSIELLVLAAVNKAFKVFNEKFFARTEACMMICYL